MPTFTSTYRYDGLGRRIEKVENGQTKRYVYDGEDILLEYDGSNVLQARYTHGPSFRLTTLRSEEFTKIRIWMPRPEGRG